MADDNQTKDPHKVDKEVEKLAQETGRAIREADPETQRELEDAASAMIREESGAESQREASERRQRRPLNPLALGILFLLIGMGFLFLMPPVGMVLVVGGLVGLVWGIVRTFVKA